jgi:hypothetical protein
MEKITSFSQHEFHFEKMKQSFGKDVSHLFLGDCVAINHGENYIFFST